MTPNKPGRPPLDRTSRSVNVNVYMPATMYDKSYQAARRQRVTVAEWIRAAIRRTLPKARDRDEV